MKKTFLICTRPIENWEIFTPNSREKTTHNSVSLLFLYKEQQLPHVSFSEVWYLDQRNWEEENEKRRKKISYQEFLEQVFSHDLSLVI